MNIADNWTKSLFPGITDYVIISVYLIVIFLIAFNIQEKKREENIVYRFYIWGLFAKIIGVIGFCLVYTLYYEGHDTTNYYRSSEALINLLFKSPKYYFSILFNGIQPGYRSFFDLSTGYPWYMSDPHSFAVIRISSVFTLLGFKNYFTASILIAWVAYSGIWKLYIVFTDMFKGNYKELAIAILFFPSVLFWGSGILKDTFTLMAAGWFVYGFYMLFIKKNIRIKYMLAILVSSYFMIIIKPYIFVALLPGSMIWASFEQLKKIKNIFVRIAIGPAIILLFLYIATLFISGLEDKLGQYASVDGIIRKAAITQEDLTRAHQYGENFFDIGELDGTFLNFISKAPRAIFAAFFRPMIWEGSSAVIFISGIENMLILLLFLFVFFRAGPVGFFRIAGRSPAILFSLLFALIFAFAVGVSTANFGAMVRLRIPLLPFLAITLFAINFYCKRLNALKKL